jgi:hypothetical protein
MFWWCIGVFSMLSDAFAKPDQRVFKARGVTDLFKVSGLGKLSTAMFPLHLLSGCVIAGETELFFIL